MSGMEGQKGMSGMSGMEGQKGMSDERMEGKKEGYVPCQRKEKVVVK